MILDLLKKKMIDSPFCFHDGDYYFFFERPINDNFMEYLIKRSKDWIGKQDAAAFRWNSCFDEKITLSSWDDRYLPKGLVVTKRYLKKLKRNLPFDEAFSVLPTLYIQLEELKHILYSFCTEYNYACVLLTENCNMKCTMCFFHGNKFAENRKLTRTQISSETFSLFIDNIDNKSLLISSPGEILLHKNFIELLSLAAKKIDRITIGTNGLLFTKEIAEKVLDLGIYEVNFSVDGIDAEFYESKRIGSSFSTVLNNIIEFRNLRDAGNFKTRISINCILFDKIRNQKNIILDFWKNKTDAVSFLMEQYDFYAKNDRIILQNSIKKICFQPFFEGPVISPDGFIAPCCHLIFHTWFNPLQCLYNIKDISPNAAMAMYRKMMLDSESELYKACLKCEWHIQSFLDGTSNNGTTDSYLLEE